MTEPIKQLTRDKEGKTVIWVGGKKFTAEQLEKEMYDANSEVGKKLRSVEPQLENY